MLDLALKAEPRLGGFQNNVGGTELAEVTDLAIVSIAVPLDGEAAFDAALSKAYGTERPAPGQSALSPDGQTRFLWTAPDQLFALFEDTSPKAADDVRERLGGKAYVTLQSDNWVALRLAGGMARVALERICPIDLHPSAFGEGHVARTAMEHMGAFVLREGIHSFLLLSASSSAESFLHAVETSLKNVA
ncbi:MAG: sarcosine oxidase subunit gamma family protein [Alphaproteobacteria bacterium]